MQRKKYFHSVKDEMVQSTRLRLVKWNISSFALSWKYLYHCTHKHLLFVYYFKIICFVLVSENKSEECFSIKCCAIIFTRKHDQDDKTWKENYRGNATTSLTGWFVVFTNISNPKFSRDFANLGLRRWIFAPKLSHSLGKVRATLCPIISRRQMGEHQWGSCEVKI